jgi:hypothetical protein
VLVKCPGRSGSDVRIWPRGARSTWAISIDLVDHIISTCPVDFATTTPAQIALLTRQNAKQGDHVNKSSQPPSSHSSTAMPTPDKPNYSKPNPPPPFLSLPRSRSGTTSSIQSINSVATLCPPTASSSALTSPWGPSSPANSGAGRRASMARYGSSSSSHDRQLGQNRRPSLMSIKSLGGTGSSGSISRTSVRGIASRSRSTPLISSSREGGTDGCGGDLEPDALVTSPLRTSYQVDEDVDGDRPPDLAVRSADTLQPGVQRRSPSEEALLQSLKAGRGDPGKEEHTLRTFVDSRRQTPTENIRQSEPEPNSDLDAAMKTPRMDAVPIPSSSDTLTATDERVAGEDLSKSIGRHSIDTFKTARATPANGSIREKSMAVDASANELEPSQTQPVEPVEPETRNDMAVEQENEVVTSVSPAVEAPAGLVWTLGTWVYSSIPSIRGGTVPPEGTSQGGPASEVDTVAEVQPEQANGATMGLAVPSEGVSMDVDATDEPDRVQLANIAVVPALVADENPPATPIGNEQHPAPASVRGWGDTFRWRKSALQTQSPIDQSTKADDPQGAVDQPEAGVAPGLSGDAEPVSKDSPDTSMSAATEITAQANVVPGAVNAGEERQGWASYFRPRRDPLVAALQQKEATRTGVASLPAESTPILADGAIPAAESEITTTVEAAPETATNDVQATVSDASVPPSRWWFGRSASGTMNNGAPKTPRNESNDNETPVTISASLPQGAATTSNQPNEPQRLATPSMTPPLRSERRFSGVSRRNLVLPSWSATFDRPPRAGTDTTGDASEPTASLPKVVSDGTHCWKGIRRVVIIGVHGWFPNFTALQK